MTAGPLVGRWVVSMVEPLAAGLAVHWVDSSAALWDPQLAARLVLLKAEQWAAWKVDYSAGMSADEMAVLTVDC